jgi:hypothetical protein
LQALCEEGVEGVAGEFAAAFRDLLVASTKHLAVALESKKPFLHLVFRKVNWVKIFDNCFMDMCL